MHVRRARSTAPLSEEDIAYAYAARPAQCTINNSEREEALLKLTEIIGQGCAQCDEFGRRYYWSSTVNATQESSDDEAMDRKRVDEVINQCSRDAANLLSSSRLDGHCPVVDIDDAPMRLIPSSTKGHYHLYIDKKMTFEQMMGILEAFANAGLVARSWVQHVKRDGQAFVRPPHVRKPWAEEPCDNAF